MWQRVSSRLSELCAAIIAVTVAGMTTPQFFNRWGWWIIIICAVLYVMNVLLREVYTAITRRRYPLVKLLYLLERRGVSFVGSGPRGPEIMKVAELLRQCAVDGQIAFSGRDALNQNYMAGPLIELEAASWMNLEFSPLSFQDFEARERPARQNLVTRVTGIGSNRQKLKDIHLSGIWPWFWAFGAARTVKASAKENS
ncbi:MAG: hypothetical protein EP335_04180 [Alphaproteobacteria bacterium]|nr:MAG: hypothetical protein EP335_04180 [Alphaproteobacteria bacterium]